MISAGELHKPITDVGRKVDLVAAVRPDISTHELLPHEAELMKAIMCRIASPKHNLVIGLAVLVSAEGELERLKTVVVRQEGEEGAKGIRRGRGVGQNVSQ